MTALAVCGFLAGTTSARASQTVSASPLQPGQTIHLAPGAQTLLRIQFKNTGELAWTRGVAGEEASLGVVGDDPSFADSGAAVRWRSSTRAAIQQEQYVAPGTIASFVFSVRNPTDGKPRMVRLAPVIEGLASTATSPFELALVPADSKYAADIVSVSAPPLIAPEQESGPLIVTARNAGTAPWKRDGTNGIHLGIRGDDPDYAEFDSGWLSNVRPAGLTEPTVMPGEYGYFEFRVRAGDSFAVETIPLELVVEGIEWLPDSKVDLPVAVLPWLTVPNDGTVSPGSTLRPAVTEIQRGLAIAWDIGFLPDGRMLVTERDLGTVKVFASGAPGAPLLSTNVLPRFVTASTESGAEGLAVDPDFARTRAVYVCASQTQADGQAHNEVSRYVIEADHLVFDRTILDGPVVGWEHNGCRVRFGPDGKLWVSLGDGGGNGSAQTPTDLAGKVLRLEADGRVPADNPVLAGAPGPTLVYSLGHRNPQGLAFAGDGTLFEVEHGPDRDDEINIIRPGANYGWPDVTGYDTLPGTVAAEWASGFPTLATSGAAFLEDPAWGPWSGSLVVAALKANRLLRFVWSGSDLTLADDIIPSGYGRLRSPIVGPDGALYVTTSNATDTSSGTDALDVILRVAPISAPSP